MNGMCQRLGYKIVPGQKCRPSDKRPDVFRLLTHIYPRHAESKLAQDAIDKKKFAPTLDRQDPRDDPAFQELLQVQPRLPIIQSVEDFSQRKEKKRSLERVPPKTPTKKRGRSVVPTPLKHEGRHEQGYCPSASSQLSFDIRKKPRTLGTIDGSN